jgi:hypothetical protein
LREASVAKELLEEQLVDVKAQLDFSQQKHYTEQQRSEALKEQVNE